MQRRRRTVQVHLQELRPHCRYHRLESQGKHREYETSESSTLGVAMAISLECHGNDIADAPETSMLKPSERERDRQRGVV